MHSEFYEVLRTMYISVYFPVSLDDSPDWISNWTDSGTLYSVVHCRSTEYAAVKCIL